MGLNCQFYLYEYVSAVAAVSLCAVYITTGNRRLKVPYMVCDRIGRMDREVKYNLKSHVT